MRIRRKNIIYTVLLFLIHCTTIAQDRNYATRIMDSLCSPAYFGRGYLNDGDRKAGEFIRNEMIHAGLLPLADDYRHRFSFPVNTFPEDLIFQIDGKNMQAGVDFIPAPHATSFHAVHQKLRLVKKEDLLSKCRYRKLRREIKSGVVLVLDTTTDEKAMVKRKELMKETRVSFYIELVNNLVWSVSTKENKASFQMLVGSYPLNAALTEIKIVNKFIPNYQTANIAGYIKGKEHPDSFLVVTAHYDHLGGIGKSVFFPGANDNASGVAMMLDLAHYFQQHPPAYSIAFIAFAAEEAGLIGSFHWVKDSRQLIPLNKIRFLVNIDLMGSGDEGIMAVNGAVFTEEFEKLTNINSTHHLLTEVKARGKAANSDHYFFTEAGVRGFFFYLMGKYKHYHNVYDSPENLRLNDHYNRAFTLISGFISSFYIHDYE